MNTESRAKQLFDSEKKLLNCADLAEKLGMSEKAIRRRVERDEIPYFKVGKSVRFDVDEVVEWLTKKKGAKNVL